MMRPVHRALGGADAFASWSYDKREKSVGTHEPITRHIAHVYEYLELITCGSEVVSTTVLLLHR